MEGSGKPLACTERMCETVKAITIWQPWASLLAMGAKQYETRSWATSYRGPIAIHAAAMKVPQVLKKLFPYDDSSRPKSKFLDSVAKGMGGVYTTEELMDAMNELPTGAVIATAELVDVWHIKGVHRIPGKINGVPTGAESQDGTRLLAVLESMNRRKRQGKDTVYLYHLGVLEGEIALGDWTSGRYAWELANVKPITPVPVKGKQGLWQWEAPADN